MNPEALKQLSQLQLLLCPADLFPSSCWEDDDDEEEDLGPLLRLLSEKKSPMSSRRDVTLSENSSLRRACPLEGMVGGRGGWCRGVRGGLLKDRGAPVGAAMAARSRATASAALRRSARTKSSSASSTLAVMDTFVILRGRRRVLRGLRPRLLRRALRSKHRRPRILTKSSFSLWLRLLLALAETWDTESKHSL